MNEIQAVASGLASIKTAIDIVKTLKGIDRSYNDAETKLKFIDLMEQLADIREKMLDIRDENIAYREQIQTLENKLLIKELVKFEDGVYWRHDDEKRDGPFCQKCKDVDDKLVYLHDDNYEDDRGITHYFWHCKACKSEYNHD